MSRAPRTWELPGPSAFARRVAEAAARQGVVAVIVPPHALDGVEAAVEEPLARGYLETIDARSGEAPLAALSRTFGVALKGAITLPKEADAQGRAAFVAGLDPTTLPRWETTLRAYASGCRGRPRHGPCLVLGCAPAVRRAVAGIGIEALPWEDVVGSQDAMLWALKETGSRDPVSNRLAVETAVSLAGWELDEVERQMRRLAGSPRAPFERPDLGPAARNPAWDRGETDKLDGRDFVRLSLCGPEEIRRRLWRAQVAALFGWLEGLRSAYVERHHPALARGTGAADPYDLEWGELVQAVRLALPPGDPRRDLAEAARRVRNALAHLEPLDGADFERLRRLGASLA